MFSHQTKFALFEAAIRDQDYDLSVRIDQKPAN